jgi:hypothetical protein
MPNLTTTLEEIRKHNPCESGWKKLCKTLGTSNPNEQVTLLQILDSNCVEDAFWSLRCWDYREWCLLIADVIEPALQYSESEAVREMSNTIRKWHKGALSNDNLSAARAAARSAARSAASDAAAWAAAWDAAWERNEELMREFIER